MTTTSDKRKRDEGVEHHDSLPLAAVAQVAGIHQVHGQYCICGFHSPISRDRTRHILESALPILRTQWAEEVKAAIEQEAEDANWNKTFLNGLDHASRIVDNYGKATS